MTTLRLFAFLVGLFLVLAVASCAGQSEPTTEPTLPPATTDGASDTATSPAAPVAQEAAPPTPTPPQTAADIYATYCVACHGSGGEGTPAGVALNTEAVRDQSQQELAATIHDGVPGTAMAGWGRVLTPAQVDALAAYVQTWKAPAIASADTPPTATPPDPTDPQSVQTAGAQLYATYCASCHGEQGSGGLGPVLNSQQFLSRFDDATIRDAILYGGWRPNSQMPAYGSHLTSAQVETLVNFIRAWEPNAPSVPDFRGDAMAEQGQGQSQGQGQGQGMGMGQGQGQGMGQQRGEPTAYTGEVVAVERSLLRVQTDAGDEIGVLLGPPWYWQDAGITLEPGDRVQLEAFTPGQQTTDDFYLGLNWLENLDTGERYVLRGEDGRPVFRR